MIAKEDKQDSGALSKSIHSGKWMTFGMVAQKVLSAVTFFILARLLMPADYGIIAVILVITTFADRFTSHGIETALARQREKIDGYLDAIWTINILKSFFAFAAIFLLAKPLSLFFNIPEAYNVIRLGALLVVLPNFSNIRQIYFFTSLDFKKIFWRDFISQIFYTLTALTFALFVSASVWALLAGHLVRIFTAAAMTYILYPSRPRLSFKFRPLLQFLSYSKWIVGQNIFDYIIGLIDQIFIGRLLGAEKLGYYAKANDLASTTTAPLISIIRKVAFYAYNTVQLDLKKIQDGFVKSLDIILLAAIPFNFFLIVEGGAIVNILLGQKWLSMVLPLKIIAVAQIFYAISSLTYPLFNSIGKPKINFQMTVLRLVLSAPLFYFGIQRKGIVGAALAMLVISLIILLYSIWQARPVLKFGWSRILPSVLHIGLAMFPIASFAILLRPFIHSFGNDYLIVAWVAFLSVAYAALIFLFGKFFSSGPKDTLLTVIRELKSN